MLALLVASVALAVAAGVQDGPAAGSRFVCTALPLEAARAGCPLPAMPMQGGAQRKSILYYHNNFILIVCFQNQLWLLCTSNKFICFWYNG